MAERPPIPFDAALVTAIASVAGVALCFALGALAVDGWHSAVGVAIGGLVATANLWMLAHVSRNVLGGGRRKRIWGLLGAAKVIALLGGMYLLLNQEVLSGAAFAIGYIALPIGIAIGHVVARRPDDEQPPSPARTDLLNAAPTDD